MSRLHRCGLLACLSAVLLLGGGCGEGARSGSVHQAHLPFGPWWSYPTLYEGELALGRPKRLPTVAPDLLDPDDGE